MKVGRSGQNGKVRLSPSSIEAMQRMAGGERVNDIAGSWGVSKKTVHASLSRARRLLGAKTNLQAIVLWEKQRNGH